MRRVGLARRASAAAMLLVLVPTVARGQDPVTATAAGISAAEWISAGAAVVESASAAVAVAQAQQSAVPEVVAIAVGLDPEAPPLVVGDNARVVIRVTGSFGDVGEVDDRVGDGRITVYMQSRSHARQEVASGISNLQPIFDRTVSPAPDLEGFDVGDDEITVSVVVEGEDNTGYSWDQWARASRDEKHTIVVHRPYDLVGTHGEPYFEPATREIEHGAPVRTWIHVKRRSTEDGLATRVFNGGAHIHARPLPRNDMRGDERVEMVLEWIQGHHAAHPCNQPTMTFFVRPFHTSYRIRQRQFDLYRSTDWTPAAEDALGDLLVVCRASCSGTALAADEFEAVNYFGHPPQARTPAPRQTSLRLVAPGGGGIPGSYVVLRDSFGNQATLLPDPEGFASGELMLGGEVTVAAVGGLYHLDLATTLDAEELETEQVFVMPEANTPDIVGRVVDDDGAPVEGAIYLLPGDPELIDQYTAWLASIAPGTDPVAPDWLTALPRTPTVAGEFHVPSQSSILSMGPEPALASLVIVPERRLGRAFSGVPVRRIAVDLTQRRTLHVPEIVMPMAAPVAATATIDYVFSRLDPAGQVVALAGLRITAVDPTTATVLADGTSDPFGGLTLTVPTGVPVELRVDPTAATALGVVVAAPRVIRIDRDVALSPRVPVPSATIDAIVPSGAGLRIIGVGVAGATVEIDRGDAQVATTVVAPDGTFSAEVEVPVGTAIAVRQVIGNGASTRTPMTLDEATAMTLALAHVHEGRAQPALDLDDDGEVGVTDLQRLANAL